MLPHLHRERAAPQAILVLTPIALPLPTREVLGASWSWVLVAGWELNVPQVLQLLLQLLCKLLEGWALAWLQLPAALHQGIDSGRAALRGVHAVPLLQQLCHLLQGLPGWRSQLATPFPALVREQWDVPAPLLPVGCNLWCSPAQCSPAWGRVPFQRKRFPTGGSRSSTHLTWRKISAVAGEGEVEAEVSGTS